MLHASTLTARTAATVVPKLFRANATLLGPRNLDWMGGAHDRGAEYLAQSGIESRVYDPVHRTPEHNAAVLAWATDDPVDTVTLCNVLSSIEDRDSHRDIVSQCRKYLRPGGYLYAQVHTEKATPSCFTATGWQWYQPPDWYLPAFHQVFGARRVGIRRGTIVAHNP